MESQDNVTPEEKSHVVRYQVGVAYHLRTALVKVVQTTEKVRILLGQMEFDFDQSPW